MTTTNRPEKLADFTPLDSVIEDLRLQRSMTEDSLRSAGQTLIDRIERTFRSLDNDQHINALGELQGTASEFDRLCAQRQQMVEFAKRLDFLARKAEEASAQKSDPVATDRREDEPCQRGTVGCSVNHQSDSPCATW